MANMTNLGAQALSIEDYETGAFSLAFQAFHRRIRSLSTRAALPALELQDIISIAPSLKARSYLLSPLSVLSVLTPLLLLLLFSSFAAARDV